MFCSTPRRKSEIYKFFDIQAYAMWQLVEPLIKSGRLVAWNRGGVFDGRDCGIKLVDPSAGLSEEKDLIEFCRTPRTRLELWDFFGSKSFDIHIDTHIAKGVLKSALPRESSSREQRFYSE